MENTDYLYYIMESSYDIPSVPSLKRASKERYLMKKHKIENPSLMEFRLRGSFRKPNFVDCHFASADYVVSQKICDVLSSMSIEGLQLLPAIIKFKSEIIENYYGILLYNRIKCVDRKLSSCSVTDIGVHDVEKLVLNKEILQDIPLEKRLAFKLKEDPAFCIYHKSVVDVIEAISPKGLRFIDVEEWTISSKYD